MTATRLEVTRSEQASFRCVRVRQRTLGGGFHFHPEYQLTLVIRGHGQRIVGDSIAPLAPGDLTLLGPDLPHVWDVDQPTTGSARRPPRRRPPVDAVIVQFQAEFLGRDFWDLPETAGIVRLLRAAARGLAFPPVVREHVGPQVVRLTRLAGLERLTTLLGVLDALAVAGGTPLCSRGFAPGFHTTDHDRLTAVIGRIHEHLQAGRRPPTRAQLARLAGLAERSFSHYFRAKMGRTLPRFVNELRIGRARILLADTAMPVASVARACGFHNLSNFNAHFRAIVGATPAAYRGVLTSR